MENTQVNKEEDNKKKTDEELVHLWRELGLLPAVSFSIGTVVGSGIFIALKGVLMNSGSGGLSLLVWALCGVLSLFGKIKIKCTLSLYSWLKTCFHTFKIGSLCIYVLNIWCFLCLLWIKYGFKRLANHCVLFLFIFHVASFSLRQLTFCCYISLSVPCLNRNMPLAIIFSMVTLTVLYRLVNVAYYTVLAPAELLLPDAVALLLPFFLIFFVGAREAMIHTCKHTPLPAYSLMVIMLIGEDISQLISLTFFSHWLSTALAPWGMVPVIIAVTFRAVCALMLSGIPIYYMTVYHFHLPPRCRRIFNYCSKLLQILLEVAQEEVSAC
uniref:Si:ch73-352p4.8 n=1 Tax=Amphilophus citrinellus TaxID=61819 RepID=A0A3Q0RQ16_AMPCI